MTSFIFFQSGRRNKAFTGFGRIKSQALYVIHADLTVFGHYGNHVGNYIKITARRNFVVNLGIEHFAPRPI